MVKITNLNKYFYRNKKNEIHVINDATLEFPTTGLVTIVGESGSGKTTLMNVIGGLDNFASGSLIIDDVEINKYKSSKIDKVRNEKIGYIFQNYLLLQERTVMDNLKLVLNMYKIKEEEKNERIEYVLKAVGMLKYKKKKVSELSGGQQQRVAIARALIKSPSLILADEPTGNLDEKNTIQIMKIIKKISETRLVILVSHEKNIAESFSDYIVEVCDGKIINTKSVGKNNSYSYEDDQNLYLKEYEYSNISNESVNIDFYSNVESKINLQIVYEKGKFYIKSSEKVVLLNEESEVKIINDHKQELDTTEESDFELQSLEFVKTPRLSFKEQFKLATSNLQKVKKRTLVLALPLMVLIVLVLLSIQTIISEKDVDRQSLVYRDSRIYTIKFDKGDAKVLTDATRFGLLTFYDGFVEENPDIEPVIDVFATLTIKFEFTLPNFSQLSKEKYTFQNFSILPLDYVSEDKLIYGRMPEKANEIVVDKWVIENTINDSTLGNLMDVYSFLNKEITYTERPNNPYKIVGISECEENTIYLNKWSLFEFYPSTIKKDGTFVCSQSEFEKFLGKPLDIKLIDNKAIKNKDSKTVKKMGEFVLNADSRVKLNIIDSIDFGDCPFDLVVPDDMYDEIFRSVVKTYSDELNVYCETKEEVEQVQKYIETVKDYFASGELKATHENGFIGTEPDYKDVKLNISSYSKYDNIINPYIEEANRIVTSRILVTVTIVIISIIIVYFSMKSFAIKNIYDIGVFRAVGINKGSIVSVYAIEVLIISLKTTLVGGFGTYVVTNALKLLPNYDVKNAISFGLFISVTSILIVINVIAGILPIIGCLRKTPSQILSKYDI